MSIHYVQWLNVIGAGSTSSPNALSKDTSILQHLLLLVSEMNDGVSPVERVIWASLKTRKEFKLVDYSIE
jgi:hypothetical protein